VTRIPDFSAFGGIQGKEAALPFGGVQGEQVPQPLSAAEHLKKALAISGAMARGGVSPDLAEEYSKAGNAHLEAARQAQQQEQSDAATAKAMEFDSVNGPDWRSIAGIGGGKG
jgi:hypothetical protein